MTDRVQEQAEYDLIEARAYVQHKAPYFSTTLLNLVPIWVPGLATLGVTDRLVCAIDPVFWTELPSVKMRASCLVHEVLHILLDMNRIAAMKAVDPELANVAADIPINDGMVRAEGGRLWELPEWGCFSHTFGFEEGLPAEAYFELLLKQKKKNPSSDGTGGAGKGEEYTLGDVTIANKVFAGGCGSIVGKQLQPELEDKLNIEKGRSPTEVQQVQREGARELKAEAEKAQGRGSMPAYLSDFLNWEDTKPTVPWISFVRSVLRRAMTKLTTGRSDYSMRRVSRRSYARGILRPGLVGYEPNILYVEDSSGSMGRDQLLTSRVEFCNIMQQLGLQRAHFVDADADVSSSQYISLSQIKTLPVTGRGGTDFRPAFKFAAKMRPKPDLVVYATDGDGYAPEVAPEGFEVIFLIVPSPWQRIPAPWGTTIVMSDDDGVRSAHKWVPPGTD